MRAHSVLLIVYDKVRCLPARYWLGSACKFCLSFLEAAQLEYGFAPAFIVN